MIWLYFVECDAVSVSCSEAMFVILVETVIIFVHILLGFWTQGYIMISGEIKQTWDTLFGFIQTDIYAEIRFDFSHFPSKDKKYILWRERNFSC